MKALALAAALAALALGIGAASAQTGGGESVLWGARGSVTIDGVPADGIAVTAACYEPDCNFIRHAQWDDDGWVITVPADRQAQILVGIGTHNIFLTTPPAGAFRQIDLPARSKSGHSDCLVSSEWINYQNPEPEHIGDEDTEARQESYDWENRVRFIYIHHTKVGEEPLPDGGARYIHKSVDLAEAERIASDLWRHLMGGECKIRIQFIADAPCPDARIGPICSYASPNHDGFRRSTGTITMTTTNGRADWLDLVHEVVHIVTPPGAGHNSLFERNMMRAWAYLFHDFNQSAAECVRGGYDAVWEDGRCQSREAIGRRVQEEFWANANANALAAKDAEIRRLETENSRLRGELATAQANERTWQDIASEASRDKDDLQQIIDDLRDEYAEASRIDLPDQISVRAFVLGDAVEVRVKTTYEINTPRIANGRGYEYSDWTCPAWWDMNAQCELLIRFPDSFPFGTLADAGAR